MQAMVIGKCSNGSVCDFYQLLAGLL